MKIAQILFLIIIVACLSACKQPQPAYTNSQKTDPFNLLSEDQVQQVKQKIHLLRTGMTSAQVFLTLGLSPNNMITEGGGSRSSFWTVYQLNQHHNIVFVSDFTHTNPVLIRVELDETVGLTAKSRCPTIKRLESHSNTPTFPILIIPRLERCDDGPVV
jgi:outer membrane protein assembly factor BamE (lipoprotein component of BamABCDE complex)